jgi:hypothetical protein
VRLRPLILLVLYAAATVLPAAHHLFADHDLHCEACLTAADDGPALAAACDGSCGDPAHHHHRGHDDRWCPVCQSAGAPQGHLATATGSVPAALPVQIRSLVARGAPGVADFRILSVRAPPPVTSA